MRLPSGLKTGCGWLTRHDRAPLELSKRCTVSYETVRTSPTTTAQEPLGSLKGSALASVSVVKRLPSGLYEGWLPGKTHRPGSFRTFPVSLSMTRPPTLRMSREFGCHAGC